MFKKLTIHLSESICSCPSPSQNLVWGLDIRAAEKPGLVLKCNICNAQVIVPYEKFVATIAIEAPTKNNDAQELFVAGKLFRGPAHPRKAARFKVN